MTVENQKFDTIYEKENVYRGPKWKIGKIIAIFSIITVTLIIRNLGMVWIYGSIQDQTDVLGADFKIGFMKYFLMILLFALPLVFPIIIRIKNGIYFDEPTDSLIPDVSIGNKILSKIVPILIYVVFGIILAISAVLSLAGAFTVAHLFVLVNLALIFFSAVTLYYYFGTFVLQRAKVSTTYKYIFPTVMMIGSSVVSIGATILGSRAIANALADKAQTFAAENAMLKISDPTEYLKVKPKLLAFSELFDRIDNFTLENAEAGKDITTLAIISAVAIVLGILVACAIYQLTRNFLASVLPSLSLSFGVIVLVNRVREAVNYVITDGPALIVDDEKRLARIMRNKDKMSAESFNEQVSELEAKIADVNAKIEQANSGATVAYVFMGILAAALLAFLGRCVYVFIKTCKAEKTTNN